MTTTDRNQPGPYDICIDAWEVEDAVFWLARITDWLHDGGPELAAQFTSFLRITDEDMAIADVLHRTTTTLRQILATTETPNEATTR